MHKVSVCLLCVLPTGLFAAAVGAAVPERPPNIVLIVADDLGYGELGCYGQKKIRTPQIDLLAAEGMRFRQAYSGSCVCAPARSVLMTGLHTGHTPIRANGRDQYLYSDDLTVAEVLRQAGYGTGGFGKWGLGVEKTPGHPNRQGFDEYFGFLDQVHAHFYYPYYMWKNERKFYLPENEGKKGARYSHDEVHSHALDFIRENKDRPFFCYVPYTIPHVELVVPEDSLKPYLGKFKEEPLPDPRPGYIGADRPYATFAGMVSRMDGHVGEIMALLQQLGIDRQTVVFFTSDNGGQGGPWARMTDFFDGNGPLRSYKGSFYEGGIRVPMIVRWPGRIEPGSVSDHVCAFWDFLPTAAEIAGVESPENIDGISFLPTLLGEDTAGRVQSKHEFLYWEYPHSAGIRQAVRMGDWKVVQSKPGGKFELYNLAADVGEATNVADQHPDVIKRVEDYLTSARTERRNYPVKTPRPTVKDFVR